jgi:hypothetical protein
VPAAGRWTKPIYWDESVSTSGAACCGIYRSLKCSHYANTSQKIWDTPEWLCQLDASECMRGYHADIFKRRQAISDTCKSIGRLKSICDDKFPLSYISTSQFFMPISHCCADASKIDDHPHTIVVLSVRIILGHFHQIVDWSQHLMDGFQRSIDRSERENVAPHRLDIMHRTQRTFVESLEPFLDLIVRLVTPRHQNGQVPPPWKSCAEAVQKISSFTAFKRLFSSVFVWLSDRDRWDAAPDYTSRSQMVYGLMTKSMAWRGRKIWPSTTAAYPFGDPSMPGLITFHDPSQVANAVRSLCHQAKKHLPLSIWIAPFVDFLSALDFTTPELHYLLTSGDALVSIVSIMHAHITAFRNFSDSESELLRLHWDSLEFLTRIQRTLLTLDQLLFPSRANENGDLVKLLARLMRLSTDSESFSALPCKMPEKTRSVIVDLMQSLTPAMVHYRTIRAFAPDIQKISRRYPEWSTGDDDLSRAWKSLSDAVETGVIERKDFLKRKHELCGNSKVCHSHHSMFPLPYSTQTQCDRPEIYIRDSKKCQGCGWMLYCSRRCQAEDRESHRELCGKTSACPVT